MRYALCGLSNRGLSVIPAGHRPTLWLYLGASLTIVAALAAGTGRQTPSRE